jgi:hypothetical protein
MQHITAPDIQLQVILFNYPLRPARARTHAGESAAGVDGHGQPSSRLLRHEDVPEQGQGGNRATGLCPRHHPPEPGRLPTFFNHVKQCCCSGSGIRCLFDLWIRDPRWVKNQEPDPDLGSGAFLTPGSGIGTNQDPDPG